MIVRGDARSLPLRDASVAAVVCDPPYEIGFMGKRWDKSGVAFDPDTWREAMRVLQPGGRLLAFGGSRTHHRIWCAIEDAGFVVEDTIMWLYGSGFPKHKSKLKPAYEPICVARNGATTELNIDAARIEGEPWEAHRATGLAKTKFFTEGELTEIDKVPHEGGRWPANVVVDELTAASLEASRVFYTAKAARSEREYGLEGAPKRNGGSNAKGFTEDVERGRDRNRPVANHHPTVKPVDLMRWLVRLVSKEGELILDPFCGSGTTGIAAIQEGRRFIGVELNEEYATLSRLRVLNAPLNLFGAA